MYLIEKFSYVKKKMKGSFTSMGVVIVVLFSLDDCII